MLSSRFGVSPPSRGTVRTASWWSERPIAVAALPPPRGVGIVPKTRVMFVLVVGDDQKFG